MWDLLKQTDIEQARQQLELCRDATLRKHAEEIQSLEADQAELDTLDRLIAAFSGKLKTAPAPAAAPPAPVKRHDRAALPSVKQNDHSVSHSHRIDKHSPKVRHLDRPDYSRTNFDTFSRAMAKVERGW